MLLVYGLDEDTNKSDMENLIVNYFIVCKNPCQLIHKIHSYFPLFHFQFVVHRQLFFFSDAISLGTSIFPIGLIYYAYKRGFEKQNAKDEENLTPSPANEV